MGQSRCFIFSSTTLDIRYNVNNSSSRYPPRAFGLIKNFINESRSRDVAPDRRWSIWKREYLPLHKSFKKYARSYLFELPQFLDIVCNSLCKRLFFLSTRECAQFTQRWNFISFSYAYSVSAFCNFHAFLNTLEAISFRVFRLI